MRPDLLEAPPQLAGQCCALDEPYQAPPGFFDQPFIYVFDGDGLTNGDDVPNAMISTFSGADFLLRRVAGQDRVAENMMLYDVEGRKIFDRVIKTTLRELVLVPEIMFPAATTIAFDLGTVNLVSKPGGIFSLAQIVFQGVRRYKGERRIPSYRYYEDEWSYVKDIDISSGGGGVPLRFEIDVMNFDFELLRITEQITNPGLFSLASIRPAVKILLFDQMYEPISNEPIIDDLIVDNSFSYNSIFAPGIVYRIGQQIQFEVTGLNIPAADSGGSGPAIIQLRFHGVRRRPC